jgi:hypothetical protein
VLNGLVRSEPVRIDVDPVLPAAGQNLKDIKGLEPPPGLGRWPLAVGAAVLVAAGAAAVARFGRRHPRVDRTPPAEPGAAPSRTPYDVAVERLDAVERERWAARGEVARHYEGVADALRRYLEEAEGIPARERTTSALARSLPPHLSAEGLDVRCRRLLGAADLVKFARARPAEPAAAAFLSAARDLLAGWWRAARPAPPPEDPVDEPAREAEVEADALR